MREGEQANTGGQQTGAGQMRKRRMALEDGRYLIYYTFGEGGGSAEPDGEVARAPVAAPEAEDERSV